MTAPRVPASEDSWTLRSPEGVELALPVASPATRIAAYFVDSFFVTLLVVGLGVLFVLGSSMADWIAERAGELARTRFENDRNAARSVMAPILAVVMLVFAFGEALYFSLFEGLSGGLTPGKYFLRLRVVSLTGQPVGGRAAVLRNVMRLVDVLPSAYAVGLTAMMVSPRMQRLGDHAAGTLVVRTDRIERPREIALPPDLAPLALSREQLERFGDRELQLVRSTLRRLESDPQASALVPEVARALALRLQLDDAELADPLRLLQRALVTAQQRGRDA